MSLSHHAISAQPFRSHAIKTVQVAATILVLAFLTLVSWNWFAPVLFGLAEIRFREAFGLVTFAGVFAVLLRFALGERRHG